MANLFYIPEKKYTVYKIKKGDTLESVARELGKNLDEIRYYHNVRSKIEDCIAGEFPSYLKELIVQSEKDKFIIEDRPPEKTPFLTSDFILPFRPETINNKYLVLYTVEDGEQKDVLEQRFNIRRLKAEANHDEHHFFEIDRISELYINEEILDTVAYEMAELTARVIYPLQIVVNKIGKWVDIKNYNEIKARWKNTKAAIEEKFDGEIVKEYTKDIEQAILNKDSLVAKIASNWFLRAFFNGIHMAYTPMLEFKKKIYYEPLGKAEELEFLVTQKASAYLDNLNRILVSQKGELQDEYINGIYKADYFLNPNNYFIEELLLECTIELENVRKITMKVTNLDNNIIEIDSRISLFV